MLLDKVVHSGVWLWALLGVVLGVIIQQTGVVAGEAGGWPIAVSVISTGLISAGVTIYTFRRSDRKATANTVELKTNQEAIKKEVAENVAKVQDDVSHSRTEVADMVTQAKNDVNSLRADALSKLDVIHDLVNGSKLAALRAAVEGNESNVISREFIQNIKPSEENLQMLGAARARLTEARKHYDEHVKQIMDSILKAEEAKRKEREGGQT